VTRKLSVLCVFVPLNPLMLKATLGLGVKQPGEKEEARGNI
jgi:hypothetical protein